jgi:flagellin
MASLDGVRGPVDVDISAAATDAAKQTAIEAAFTSAGYTAANGWSVTFDSTGNTNTWDIKQTVTGTDVGQISGSLDAIKLGTGGALNTQYLDIEEGTSGAFLDLKTKASAAVSAVKDALAVIGGVQGTIGSMQNKLQFAISLAQSQQVNSKAAESRIRDANIAEESANMTRYNILTQSGIASLAQANQSTSAVLSLLR